MTVLLAGIGGVGMFAVFAVTVFAATPAHGQPLILGEDDEWTAAGRIEPGTPEAGLALIRRTLAEGRMERAEFLATQWIDRHPNHPQLADAYLMRGDSLRLRREYYQSLFDYEFVVRRFTGSDAFVRALEHELDISTRFVNGMKRKLFGLRIADARDEGAEILIRVQERLPGSRLAERAAITLADHYFRERNMTLAAEMYSIFLDNHPRSRDVTKARKRLIYAHLAAFKGPEFDVRGLLEARTQLNQLRLVSPSTARDVGATALLEGIDESIARKLVTTAGWYLRSGDPVSAEFTVRRLVREHPGTLAAIDGARLILSIRDTLPARIQREMPDYESLASLQTVTEPATDTSSDSDANADSNDG